MARASHQSYGYIPICCVIFLGPFLSSSISPWAVQLAFVGGNAGLGHFSQLALALYWHRLRKEFASGLVTPPPRRLLRRESSQLAMIAVLSIGADVAASAWRSAEGIISGGGSLAAATMLLSLVRYTLALVFIYSF